MDIHREIIFIHMEKTGGTSIARSVWGHERPFNDKDDYDGGMTKHYSVDKARSETTQFRWDNFLRFTVVRNPWDRMVSKWWWRHNGALASGQILPPTLQLTDEGKIPVEWFHDEFQEQRRRWELLSDTPMDEFLFGATSLDGIEWTTGDHPRVKEVLRFESLQQDWARLIDKYPTNFKGCKRELPWCNKSSARALDYRIYYTDKTRELVSQSCPKTLLYFNYMF